MAQSVQGRADEVHFDELARLLAERVASGRDIAGLAKDAGVSSETLRRYIAGKQSPKPATRARLLTLLRDDSGDLENESHTSSSSPTLFCGAGTSSDQEASQFANPDSEEDHRMQLEQNAQVPGGGESPSERQEFRHKAYMATALTGLERLARIGVFFISDCVASVCQERGIELYQPRLKSDPVHNAELADTKVYIMDREKVTESDLVIVLCDHPSFGAGQEIEIAGAATVPLILLAMEDNKPSRMVTGTPANKAVVRFSDPETLRENLGATIDQMSQSMRDRRTRMSASDLPGDLGSRIRKLRKDRGLDPTELAEQIGVSEEYVKALESESCTVMNMSLIQLDLVSTALGVSVGELLGEDALSLSDLSRLGEPAVVLEWAGRKDVAESTLRDMSRFAARRNDATQCTNDSDLDELRRLTSPY